MDHAIVREEQQLLESVATLLAEVPYITPPSEGQIVQELLRLREDLPSAKAEDRGALMEQYNRQLALLEQLRESRNRPQVDPDSPYFAHMRLKEGDFERDLCLGKATRIERGIRIIDWRNAPISRIFYRYQQEEEYEEEIGGRMVEGIVMARRTVTVRNGTLYRVEAPEGIFTCEPGPSGESDQWNQVPLAAHRLAGGEGASLRAHRIGEGGHRRLGTDSSGVRQRLDKRLPDIAGLIDPDQFALITRPSSGFVVIRGTAGSGKTTVALHRIAYLAYSDRQIDSSQTQFMVFSPALRDYVAHVLPALGVHKVRIITLQKWALEQRRRHFPQLLKQPCDGAPEVVVRLKLHPIMLKALKLQADNTDGPKTARQAIDDWASALTDNVLLQTLLDEHDPEAFTPTELDRAITWCRRRYEDIVARHDEGDKSVRPELDIEDDALLLRAWQLRVGPLRGKNRRPLRFRHIAIDEVQDFSPIEIRVLLDCLDKKQSITLAGDTQQHVMKEAGFTSWADFFRHLGVEGTAINTLRIAHRSSRQIVEFAMSVLGDLWEDDAPPITTREGPPVELFQFTDHGAVVAFLANALKQLLDDEPHASIAVLTANRALSQLYYQGLNNSEVPRLRRVTHQDFTFKPGIEITEVNQVKGLEFDYVVLVETSAANYHDTPAARRLLHIGST
ncbi:MAG: AAA family ATPase, partial [Proteobacteria bacterium]|nr:AAA family ATPase [Pseudomonadota bacterium]